MKIYLTDYWIIFKYDNGNLNLKDRNGTSIKMWRQNESTKIFKPDKLVLISYTWIAPGQTNILHSFYNMSIYWKPELALS